jgi:uncharacterized protein DUF2470
MTSQPTAAAQTELERAEPSPAERARTLALGVVTGVVHVPGDEDGGTKAHRVQQLTQPDGSIALLVADSDPLHRLIRNQVDSGRLADIPSVLDVLDVPPGRLCLPRARLCVTGWIEPVPDAHQRLLAGRLAAARPLGTLLDVGDGYTLYEFDTGEIRITTNSGTKIIGEREFRGASPDPLYEAEDHIVVHLEMHHRDDTIAYVRRRLGPQRAARLSDVSVVGLDRYGLELLCAIGSEYESIRAPFPVPVDDDESLSKALRQLLCVPCSANPVK